MYHLYSTTVITTTVIGGGLQNGEHKSSVRRLSKNRLHGFYREYEGTISVCSCIVIEQHCLLKI